MADQTKEKRRHLVLEGVTETSRYTPHRQFVQKLAVPEQNRAAHSQRLLGALELVRTDAQRIREAQIAEAVEDGDGIQVEFESFPGIDLAFGSLSRERSGIELLNVRSDHEHIFATVFVPDGKLQHFEGLIAAYVEERRSATGKRLDHSDLINSISTIRTASLKALWTDEAELFPADEAEAIWWEVWLPVRKDRASVVDRFSRVATAQGMHVSDGEVVFPERTVLQVQATAAQMKKSMLLLNSIAELRRAKETADFFDSLYPEEQPEWTGDLLARLSFSPENEHTPYICVLDTGVNRGHPLLEASVNSNDLHTIEPGWGAQDADGHGTGMAGLALFGGLAGALASNEVIDLRHRLESVKILPADGSNDGDALHHAHLMVEAVSRPEVTAPNRKRVFSLAITAKDYRDRGRPSAWSSVVDGLASDAASQGQDPRLIIISGGNIRDPDAWVKYPDSNSSDAIHDPGQAWNAVTVGAYTELSAIAEADAKHYSAIAKSGGLSPFSTTSRTWARQWPLKPDVLFEGGNAGKNKLGAACITSLSLLTTHHDLTDRHYTTTNATSAAAAAAANMAAKIQQAYPSMWPETVRALLVHSARWTDAMWEVYSPYGEKSNKADIENLIRHCGYGVPDIDRALWSASDSLTLILQETLHPFIREGSVDKMQDMQLHRLPWPLAELGALGEQQVRMRVTLSYFVEPNPSARGIRSRYRYESHGLRFDVKRPLESDRDFLVRINAAATAEEDGAPIAMNDPGWLVGKQNRHRGSLHSDVWIGSASELASRGLIGIYPTMGWWRTRSQHNRVGSVARYSLLVSIEAPGIDVDLYTAIENKLAIPLHIKV
ncbi:subtilase family protein [Lysobacter capsici]|uniref:S8 family peptidase n=1 Tax=Lysobacter capsici TaxID=435897 RepID=UPI00071F59D8|nr:S8 family peptidase [Lysobacter capsici]ALN83911.1 subtilase family protein [Lysobacter capsici]